MPFVIIQVLIRLHEHHTASASITYRMRCAIPMTTTSGLFWDGVHPTTYAHSILGAEFRAAVPEPESILLLAIGLLGIFVTRRRAA